MQELYCDGAGTGVTVWENYATAVDFTLSNTGAGVMNMVVDGSVHCDTLYANVIPGFGGGGTGIITDQNGTAHRTLYVNGTGDVSELAYGTANYGLLSNGATTAPSWGAVVRPGAPTNYSAGQKQVFRSDATTSGFGFYGVASDPSSPAQGDMWYNSTAGEVRYRDATLTRSLVTLTGIQTLTNKTLTAPALGTPASGVLSSCTGYDGADIVATGVTDGYVLTANGSNGAGWEAPVDTLCASVIIETPADADVFTIMMVRSAITVIETRTSLVGTGSPSAAWTLYQGATADATTTSIETGTETDGTENVDASMSGTAAVAAGQCLVLDIGAITTTTKLYFTVYYTKP